MDNLITRVALELASYRAVDYWFATEEDYKKARAVVGMVLGDAANIKKPDMSRRYCTNDEAFFNEGFDAALSAIRALGE